MNGPEAYKRFRRPIHAAVVADPLAAARATDQMVVLFDEMPYVHEPQLTLFAGARSALRASELRREPLSAVLARLLFLDAIQPRAQNAAPWRRIRRWLHCGPPCAPTPTACASIAGLTSLPASWREWRAPHEQWHRRGPSNRTPHSTISYTSRTYLRVFPTCATPRIAWIFLPIASIDTTHKRPFLVRARSWTHRRGG